MKKKRNKKYIPRSLSQPYLNLFQIDAIVRPLEDFIDTVSSGEVELNDENEVVVNLFRSTGIEAFRAEDNIIGILEVYLQVCLFCLDDKTSARASSEYIAFEKDVLKPLKGDAPILKSSLIKAKLMCVHFREALRAAPAAKVKRCSVEICDAVTRHGRATKEQMRAWLFKELESAA